MKVFTLVTAVFFLLTAILIATVIFELVPLAEVNATLLAAQKFFSADLYFQGLGILLILLFLALAFVSVRLMFPRNGRTFSYDIPEGEVVVPFELIERMTKEVLQRFPELRSKGITVSGRSSGPRLSLDLSVTGENLIGELAKSLKTQLQREIANHTGVAMKEIKLRIELTDKHPTVYLPHTKEAVEEAVVEEMVEARPQDPNIAAKTPPIDFSAIDLEDFQPAKTEEEESATESIEIPAVEDTETPVGERTEMQYSESMATPTAKSTETAFAESTETRSEESIETPSVESTATQASESIAVPVVESTEALSEESIETPSVESAETPYSERVAPWATGSTETAFAEGTETRSEESIETPSVEGEETQYSESIASPAGEGMETSSAENIETPVTERTEVTSEEPATEGIESKPDRGEEDRFASPYQYPAASNNSADEK